MIVLLSKLIQGFKRFSKKIAAIQARIILTVVYILFTPIFAFLLRISKGKTYKKTGWLPWTIHLDSIEDLKKQF